MINVHDVTDWQLPANKNL